ncbi:hypothetical protein BDV93DRAFT_514563 [Ceratobasidium sp. AG-I]|nr:hypothetical protein BDV93DRAFT_514563 [Ceratobasidium sp. AG-I]
MYILRNYRYSQNGMIHVVLVSVARLQDVKEALNQGEKEQEHVQVKNVNREVLRRISIMKIVNTPGILRNVPSGIESSQKPKRGVEAMQASIVRLASRAAGKARKHQSEKCSQVNTMQIGAEGNEEPETLYIKTCIQGESELKQCAKYAMGFKVSRHAIRPGWDLTSTDTEAKRTGTTVHEEKCMYAHMERNKRRSIHAVSKDWFTKNAYTRQKATRALANALHAVGTKTLLQSYKGARNSPVFIVMNYSVESTEVKLVVYHRYRSRDTVY